MPVLSRGSDQFNLRLPDGMRARIAARAKGNMRSMNGEIVTMLATALGSQGEAVTGEGPRKAAPVTDPDNTALQGGPIHHG